jgi:hypothetical protein
LSSELSKGPEDSPRAPVISTPVAILIGSVIVALGLYLGLRQRAPTQAEVPVAPTAPLAGANTATSTAASPAGQTPPVPATSASVDVPAAAKAARAALEKHKKAALEKCWAPSAKTQPEPASVKYVFNLNFGPDGKQVTRGITEPRGGNRPGVVNCMQAELPPIEIPAQGQPVAVEVELTLP